MSKVKYLYYASSIICNLVQNSHNLYCTIVLFLPDARYLYTIVMCIIFLVLPKQLAVPY